MVVFTKRVGGFSLLAIFAKSFFLDVWEDSDFLSEPSNDLRKKLHLRSLAGSFWVHLCINYFHKSVSYLFTKFDKQFPPYIKQNSIVHGQIHVILVSAYLFDNENYNSVSQPYVSK